MGEQLPVYDGDTLLFHCPEATGYLYSEPLSSATNLVTVYPSREDAPQFPNIDFATFRIMHGRLSNGVQLLGKEGMGQSPTLTQPMTIVYGSTIQLQHQASGKFLSITPANSAWLDNGKAETSFFRLIPPRQEKGWGEDLIVNDNIKLESIYYKGYRIQCVNNPLEASYHLVLSVTGTIFSIKSHCHKRVTIEPQVIKGGNVIMLSSMKIDGYVSIKGSFVSKKLPEEFRKSHREVGLRRWRQGFFKILPFSGDTYLQFEKVSHVSTGDPFLFGEECRIKHLPTQLYISVSKTPHGIEIIAQDLKEANGSELFKIIPLASSYTGEQQQVQAFHQISLQHVKSQKLLSVNVRPVLYKKLSAQQDHLSQWFTLALEECKDEIPSTSIYQIIKVDEDARSDVYSVTGMSSFLCNYFRKISNILKEKSLDTKTALQLTNLLQDVITQMTGLELLFNTSLNKKRVTNMLRTFQTIDALIALLMAMSNGTTTIYVKHQACSSICSILEKYCEIGNLKSRRYLARRELLNVLMSTVGRGFGTENVLITLSKDDVEMGDLMQEFLISLIEKLNTEDPEVAELMTTLAFSGRRYNKEIQEKIYEKTLQIGMVHNHNANSDVRLILEGFLKTISLYLETTGITASRLVSTYDYMSLDLTTGRVQVIIDEEHMTTIQAMINSICRYLSTNEMYVLYAGNDFKGRNSILAQILGVVAFLVNYGIFKQDSKIEYTLLKLLDGRTDEGLPGEPFYSHDRYNVHKFTGNRIMFKIKSLILQSLQFFLKRQFHASVENFLYDFKCLRGKGDELYYPQVLVEDEDTINSPKFSIEGAPSSPQTVLRSLESQEEVPIDIRRPSKTRGDGGEQGIELVDITVQSNTISGHSDRVYAPPPPEMNKLLDDDESITELLSQLSHERLRYNFKTHSYQMFDIDTVECSRLCNILLDLINYDDTDVCLMSTELLYDIYDVERTLLTDAQGVYFITPYSNDKCYTEMKQVATLTDKDQLISQMLRKQIHDVPKLLQKLEEFSNWCVSKDDITEPNTSNQGIAYSCGLFNSILEFVLEYGQSDDFDLEQVIMGCFMLLQKVTIKNTIAQDKLFNNLHDFLDMRTGIASMTCLLNEVFSNNSALCQKLSESDIKHIFYTAIGSSNPEHYELTVTLGTIIENIEPSTPLQEYISQLILDHWEDNLGHIFGHNNQGNRVNLLQYAGDEDPELHLLLNVTDLIASCTTGECQFAESVSRKFFTLDELLLLLMDENIAIHRKLPFVRVLTWTYLNTERDSSLACSQLASSKNFWTHLEEQIHLIDSKFLKEIKSLSPSQKKILQVKFKSLSKSNWSITQWIAYTADFDGSTPTAITGKLLYIIEGIILLLSGFCFEMSLHLSGGNELCTDLLTVKEIGIVNMLGDTLLSLHRLDIIVASEHINKLRQCINNITSLCDSLHVATTFNQMAIHGINRSRAVSYVSINNNSETTLNKDFQSYTNKYMESYNEISDSGFEDDVQKSLTLPKGPSFEKLIDLFSDENEDLKSNSSLLKAKKLILILKTLIQKQKRQGLRSMERTSLEKVTLTTLQLLCGVIFKKIAKVPRGDLQPDDFQRQYMEIIQPIQNIFLNEGIIEMLIGLLHHPKDDIAFQVLACLNVLLYPGNEDAQRKITAHVHEQDRSLFLRVHQILRRAQSSLSTAKMSNALAQIAALIQDQDEKSSSSVKLLERNKSAVFGSFIYQSSDDLSPTGSPTGSTTRLTRRSAAIESNDGGSPTAKLSIPGTKLESNFNGIEFVDYRITMALNVLSWLCDGQQKDVQDILRDDKTFSGSNIVGQVAFLLHGISENLNEKNIGVAQGAVQALIEMCAGNYSNQIIAFKGQVIVSIDTILLEDFTSSSAIRPLRKLKSSSIELMEVLLEETDEDSSVLAQWIISQWNMSNFLGAMFNLWQAYSGPFNIQDREQLRNSVFRAYHVLRRIADYKDTTVNRLVGYKKHSKGCGTQFDMIFESNADEAKRMWQYCQLWSRSVEIVYRAKSGKEILTRTYFPYDPHKHLNENEKDTILLHIKRNTPQEKLSDLLQWTEAIRSAHAWKKKVKSTWKTYWILWASTIRHFMLFWLTIFLNSLVFFALKTPSDNSFNGSQTCSVDNDTCNNTALPFFQPILTPETPNWYYPVLYIGGAVHLVLAIWMVLQYYAKHWTNIRFEILFLKKTLYNAKKGLLRRKYIYQFFHFLNKVFCCGRIHSTRPQPERYFQIFFFSFEPVYRVLFLCFSILGLATSGYFYCGCMVYLFLRNHVLLYVLRAVRKSALQLITIFILGMIVIYIYAVFSFVLLPNYFVQERDEFCTTIFQCFVTITRLGLLDTLGTGIGIRPPSGYEPNFSLVGWRTLYDLIFFIVVTTLGLNIVIAILVDRFSDLREEKDKIDDDNNTRCFICSIKKDVFERHGLNFQKHWQTEHSIWNYIHFVLYLDTLHSNDHNALEKYVSHQVPSKSNPAGFIDFFPMFKAKILPNYDVTLETE